MGFDLKEFLKPNWKKLVLAIVFLLIISQLIFWKMETLAIPILKTGFGMMFDDGSGQYGDATFYFAFAAALSYLLACVSMYVRARISGRDRVRV